VISSELVVPLTCALTIKYVASNGKVRKATINQKALVAAISFDFDENFSGDQIVFWYGNHDYWLMSKNDVLEEDLSEDGVIVTDYTTDSSDTVDGSNGRFTDRETGTFDFEFYSDEEQDQDLGDDPNILDNDLEFIDDSVAFTATETAGPIKNGEQSVTITEKDGLSAIGHDFTVVDDDFLPIFGPMTQNGSGRVPTEDVP
jgi:hypothetical protein